MHPWGGQGETGMSLVSVQSETGAEKKGRLYITNAFSVTMIESEMYLEVSKVSLEFVKRIVESAREANIPIISAVGHEGTAKLLSQLLQVEIQCNRIQIKLTHDDVLICVVLGFRIPEGKVYQLEELIQLLNEGKIVFYLVIPQKVETSGDGMWQYFVPSETWSKILKHMTLKGLQKSVSSREVRLKLE